MNSTSASWFLLLLILLITVSNYFTANRTDYRLSETNANIQKLLGSSSDSDLLKEYSIRSQKDIKEFVQRGIHREFYQRVMPEAICREKVRIGENKDGGKYVCKPEAVMDKSSCTILSLGLNNQIGFDEHIARVTGGKCKILGADKDEQKDGIKKKYAAINGQLFVGKIPDELKLPEMMKKAERKSVDLLKIDIEGGERTGLEPLLKEYPVCQIFIELHGTPAEHFQVLQMMAKYNFRIFNVDPNYQCVHCCEYSLIHESCMEQYGVIPLAITIPKEEI